MCLLTIITINFNNRDGLVATFNSVFAQSFRNFEFLVIDGGSTDGSLEVIKKHSDRINYWVSERDRGIYNAMNKGITKASGEYLLFLNSADTLATPSILAEVSSSLAGYDIIYGNLLMQDTEETWIKHYPSIVKLSYLFEDSLPHSGGMFINRNSFRGELSCYDESFKIISDWKWYTIAIFKLNYSYKHIEQVIGVFDRSGISSQSENLELLNTEKQNVLKESFPLFFEDMNNLIKLKNDYHVVMSSRVLKTWFYIKSLVKKTQPVKVV
jgi:glycosyltransferase involved in cell wall biosynthesis